MTQALFFVSATNPNDNAGGGGCVCSPTKQPDCNPPYIVAPGNEMDSLLSPHVVICERCIGTAQEYLTQGDPETVDGESVELDIPAL